MKIPAFVRIGNYKWRVIRTNRSDHNEDGYCDANKREIGVAKEGDLLADEDEASTFIHEWVHAIIDTHFPEIEEDEPLTEKLEAILVQSFRDNKTLIRSLLKALK